MFGNAYGGNYGINPNQQLFTQNRLAQMEQQQYNNMYPQQYQQGQQGQTNNNVQVLKGRPVSSFDEAKASMIDLDGSMFVFTDVANGKIYTKQIMLDGTAELKSYAIEPLPVQAQQITQTSQYVSREEFDNTLKQLDERLEKLMGEVEPYDKQNDAKSSKSNATK